MLEATIRKGQVTIKWVQRVRSIYLLQSQSPGVGYGRVISNTCVFLLWQVKIPAVKEADWWLSILSTFPLLLVIIAAYGCGPFSIRPCGVFLVMTMMTCPWLHKGGECERQRRRGEAPGESCDPGSCDRKSPADPRPHPAPAPAAGQEEPERGQRRRGLSKPGGECDVFTISIITLTQLGYNLTDSLYKWYFSTLRPILKHS